MISIEYENFNIINPIIDEFESGVPSFSCDDLMAPIISELNKRGYYTRSCCQGHYIEYDEKYRDKIYDYEYEQDYIEYTKLVLRNHKFTYPNIRFTPEVFLRLSNHISTLPSEWIASVVTDRYTKNSIDRSSINIFLNDNDYEFNTPYEFYARMVELHRILYDWVCTLPTYSDIRDIIDLNYDAILVPGGVKPNWKGSVLFLSNEEMDIHEKEVEAQLTAQLAEYHKSHPAG